MVIGLPLAPRRSERPDGTGPSSEYTIRAEVNLEVDLQTGPFTPLSPLDSDPHVIRPCEQD